MPEVSINLLKRRSLIILFAFLLITIPVGFSDYNESSIPVNVSILAVTEIRIINDLLLSKLIETSGI
jgi:hypothetical protein